MRWPRRRRADPRSLAIDLYPELVEYENTADVTPGLRAFLDLSWADMWIGNGGFIGLWQARAATIRRLPDAARHIGAPAFAALFDDANQALPPGTLDSDETLVAWLDGEHDAAFSELVTELESRYYAAGDLAEALGRFVLANPREFPR